MTDASNPAATPASSAAAVPTNTQPAKAGMSRKWLYIVLVLAFLFVLMPYLLWQATWFGRPLNDTQMAAAFADKVHPREAQHALSQVADRILSNDAATRASARKWYPQVVALASSSEVSLRLTSAWVMGQDATVPEFHSTLQNLLADFDPMVQRNAALSLVRYGDAAGHDVILSMLKPYLLVSPAAGKLFTRLTQGESVNPGTMIGRIESAGNKIEVRVKVPGTLERWLVQDGTEVKQFQEIAQLNPSSEMVYNSLLALYVIGKPEDIPVIALYAHGVSGMPANIAQRATETMTKIRDRSESPAR
jgi:biotin carboxyl carrier protein